MTLVELLIAIVLGTVILVPVYAVLTLTLTEQSPVRDANQQNAQFRVFRTQILRDWSSAAIARVGVAYDGTIECNNGVSSSYFSVNSPFNVTGPKIAIQTAPQRSLKFDGTRGVDLAHRIIYNLMPSKDGPAGTFDLIRRECDQNFNGTVDATADSGGWRTSPGSINGPDGSAVTVLRGIAGMDTPTSCNTFTDPLPYDPCDANITLRGTDGRAVTLRLHQQIGRDS